jgi:hypothetical protein
MSSYASENDVEIVMLNYIVPHVEGHPNSYLFDEPMLSEVEDAIQTVVDHEYHPSSMTNFRKMNKPQEVYNRLTTAFENIINAFMNESNLAKVGYISALSEIAKTSYDATSLTLFFTIYIAIHKGSCAYGKVIMVQGFHEMSSSASTKPTHFVLAKYIGAIPEDRLAFTASESSYVHINNVDKSAYLE